jgi:hypothetical protein
MRGVSSLRLLIVVIGLQWPNYRTPRVHVSSSGVLAIVGYRPASVSSSHSLEALTMPGVRPY